MIKHFYGIDKQLRFQYAANMLREKGMVLDVGGGRGDFFDFAVCSGVIADLPPGQSLFGRDKFSHPVVHFDGVKLPFKDASFDTVVCLDTLEHAPKDKRSSLLHELQRVSTNRIILTFPERQFFLPILLAVARLYDRFKISSFMRKSLEEHGKFGLPSRGEVLRNVDVDKWASSLVTFMGRRTTLFWITQLLLPFLASPRVNKTAAGLLSHVQEYQGGECLVLLQRVKNGMARP